MKLDKNNKERISQLEQAHLRIANNQDQLYLMLQAADKAFFEAFKRIQEEQEKQTMVLALAIKAAFADTTPEEDAALEEFIREATGGEEGSEKSLDPRGGHDWKQSQPGDQRDGASLPDDQDSSTSFAEENPSPGTVGE